MLQLSAETRIGLNFEFHPDIAVANFGGDRRNFRRPRPTHGGWTPVNAQSCFLSRLDSAKRRIGGEFGRNHEPARRNDRSKPFARWHNGACSQDRSLPIAAVNECAN